MNSDELDRYATVIKDVFYSQDAAITSSILITVLGHGVMV